MSKPHIIPPFYCCYLLQSLAKSRSFYIGSTPVPLKRLSQHNGLITAGAYKTKSSLKRPWDMICIVYGFQSKVSALRFEHALQHPYQSRFIPAEMRISKSKKSYRSLHHHLGNIRLLLHSNGFNRLHLKVAIFHQNVWDAWTDNRFNCPNGDGINAYLDIRLSEIHQQDEEQHRVSSSKYNGDSHGGIEGLDIKSVHSIPGYTERADSLLQQQQSTICHGCNQPLNQHSDLIAICHHENCTYSAHISCLATSLLHSDDYNVLPTTGKCPKCSQTIQWDSIARDAHRRRHHIPQV